MGGSRKHVKIDTCRCKHSDRSVDDQHDDLRELVDDRFVQFRMMVATIIEVGKAAGVLRVDTPSSDLATTVVGYLTGTMMQAKATQDFTLFDAGNRVMTSLLASFETTAPSAKEEASCSAR